MSQEEIKKMCPVDCVLSDDYENWKYDCESKTKSRVKKILVPASNGGNACVNNPEVFPAEEGDCVSQKKEFPMTIIFIIVLLFLICIVFVKT